jgi:hypothetical protein
MISPQPITALSQQIPPAMEGATASKGAAKAPPPISAHQAHQAHVIAAANAHQAHITAVGNAIARLKAAKKPIPVDLAHQNHAINESAKAAQLNKYLTNDSTYQSQTAAINKALGDYGAQELQQENSYNTGYAQNRSDLQEQQRVGGINQDEDFGSRGMIRSGLYATDKTDFLGDYARQFSQLDQQRNDYLLNLHQGLNNYNTSQNLALQQAKQDAINRRAIGLIGGGSPVVS